MKRELYSLIKEDESIFNFIQQFALDGLWFWDLKNPENEWMNPKFWTTLGYDPEEMPHKASAWQNIINQCDLESALKNFKKHCKNPNHPYDQVVRYQHRLGHTIWIHCKGIVIRDSDNKPFRMIGAHIDVTKIKKTELQLRKQIEKYQHVIDGTNLGIWEWNAQTGQTVFNERWAQTLGYTLLELEPVSIKTWVRSMHPEDLEKSNQLFQKHFKGETSSYECEVRMRHNNGSWIWVLNKGKIVSVNAKGEPEWVIGTQQEITKQKNDLEKHKVFIEQAPGAIAMFDTKMCYIAHSKKWLKDYNIKDENIIGKSHYDIFPEIGERWKKDHKDCINGKILESDEDHFERTDGTIQWLSWKLHPWYKSNNKVGGIIMLTEDITKAKKIENQLKLSEKKFRENFENAAIGMAVVGLDGTWLEVNNSLSTMLGYTQKELKSLSFQEITHKDDLRKDLDFIQKMISNEISFCHIEKRYIHKSGKDVYVILSVSIMKDENNKPLHFIAQISDITPRVYAREKLKNTLTQLEGILEASSQVSIIGTDVDGIIRTFNKGAENLLGYNRVNIIGKENILILHNEKEILNRSKELAADFNKNVVDFGVFTFLPNIQNYETREWTYVKKSGIEFPVQVTTTAIKENEKIIGYLSVAADISNIKKIEKEIKNLLDVANNQNRRLQNFAHIVSHNLKSHSGNFGMLLDIYCNEKPIESKHEIISLLRSASNNLTDTINHLNQVVILNSKNKLDLKSINLHKRINKIINGIWIKAKDSGVAINNKVDKDIMILGIDAYLDSIILNFLTNGIKYCCESRESYINVSTSLNKKFVIISFEDNGLGIDLKKHREKLFGMYKTFHRNKDSRGIGLFITKNQVEALGGKIEVESEVNKGTIFKVYMKYEKH
ncbi:PAS domain S-box protein [Aquimarina sp. BL5]|uniref:PAS domain S-box protein n=2 Tax=Aquimarina sp. BL5 TaxID=1714860 RepID=UPI0013C3201C|nr:PAS domain S-box protein [Aquimarina sp. BL5]